MEISNIIAPELKKIIDNTDYKIFPRHFVYPRTIVQNAILFLGINPSSSDNQIELDSYELTQDDNNHPYFKKFEDISKYCKTAWAHLDLLFFRYTDQKIIFNILKQENGVKFIWEQLQITNSLIELCNPKVIVVCNALAGIFLGKDKNDNNNKWLDFSFKFDNELGTYISKNIPVFFSSMLTGQRALDRGSYERLRWHIKKAI